MRSKLVAILFLFLSLQTNATEINQTTTSAPIDWQNLSIKEDTKKAINIIWQSSYKQFSTQRSWIATGTGALVLWPIMENDRKLSNKAARHRPHPSVRVMGALSNIFNFPIIPAIAWYQAKKTQNEKLYHFSIEYAASLYLTMIECAVLSLIPVHERPSGVPGNFFEERFRLASSFPSGHMASFSTLFFKTFQYYGPTWSIIPAIATVTAAMERVQTKRHYISDVVATVFLAFIANEGTRMVYNKPETANPIYNTIFEHQVSFMPFYLDQNTFGANLSFNF